MNVRKSQPVTSLPLPGLVTTTNTGEVVVAPVYTNMTKNKNKMK